LFERLFESGEAVGRGVHLVAFVLELEPQDADDLRVVLDEQDLVLALLVGEGARGRAHRDCVRGARCGTLSCEIHQAAEAPTASHSSVYIEVSPDVCTASTASAPIRSVACGAETTSHTSQAQIATSVPVSHSSHGRATACGR